jgi:predicted 3-demethylubiquinone-9 3-methyltransferase (glyoxalase superfamily)
MPKQIPCLWMDGTAEEAAQHYTSIFPNSSIGDISRYGPDMPPPMQEGDVRPVDGGEESMCGWLKDKFGVSWQVFPEELITLTNDPEPGRAQRATQAMLQMRRIDMAEIRRAADGVPV